VLSPNAADFDGAEYDHDEDYVRLNAQVQRMYSVASGRTIDEPWLSVAEIVQMVWDEYEIEDPENSVQANMRSLRKAKFGQYEVLGRWRLQEDGRKTKTWEYFIGQRGRGVPKHHQCKNCPLVEAELEETELELESALAEVALWKGRAQRMRRRYRSLRAKR
jgi:hypothetical protein